VLSLGIDAVINPRTITVSSILRHVRQGYIRAGYTLHEGLGEVIDAEIHEGSHLIGLTVGAIESPRHVAVAAIVRRNEVIIPRSSTPFQLDDRVVLIASNQAIKDIEMMFASQAEYF
jgi:trk system potassium uptake protein TrkA